MVKAYLMPFGPKKHQPTISMNKTALIKQQLSQKILFLDGAMGTMIQGYKLEEKDFRGERFAQWEWI